MTATPAIDCGGYIVRLQCPSCGNSSEVFIVIDTRLTVEKDGGTLRPSFHTSGVDHRCGQMSTLDAPPGGDVDEVGTPPLFSARDRAAGEHLTS